jgi:anti-sigma factor RsiW
MRRLDRAEEASISTHIAGCSRCAEYLIEIEAMSRVLRAAAEQAQDLLGEGIEVAFREERVRRRRPLSDSEREQLYSEIRAMQTRLTDIAELMLAS